MKSYKKKTALFFITILLFFVTLNCNALGYENFENSVDKIYKHKELEDLEKNLPSNVKESLQDVGINSLKPEHMQNFSIQKFFSMMFSKVIEFAKKPLNILANCLAMILLAALFTSFKPSIDENSNLAITLGTLTTICTCGVIITPLIKCITSISEIIKSLGNFTLCFAPVFTGIIAMTGNYSSALGYNSAIFILAQVISSIVADFLLPFTGAFLALSIGGSINGNFNISGLTSSVKKIIIFILSLLVSIFVGIFSIQNAITTSADGVGMKTAKFFSKSFIPIVGGALSDAMASIVGGLSLIKATVGGFGILACILTLLPPILTTAFFIVTMALSGGMAKAFGIKPIADTITAVKDCLSILLAFLVSYGILIISLTSLTITMGKN